MDRAAAREMMNRTGQMGVPVITSGDEVITGFDRPRLERIAARYPSTPGSARGPKLGLLARNGRNGVELGGTRPASPAERSGAQAGDIVVGVNGRSVRSVSDLERLTETSAPGQPITLDVQRHGQVIRLSVIAG